MKKFLILIALLSTTVFALKPQSNTAWWVGEGIPEFTIHNNSMKNFSAVITVEVKSNYNSPVTIQCLGETFNVAPSNSIICDMVPHSKIVIKRQTGESSGSYKLLGF